MLSFPYLSDRHIADEIACNLECLNSAAYYLAGDDQMNLQDLVEVQLEMTMEMYNPEQKYIDASYCLDDIICAYNYEMYEEGSLELTLRLCIDEEETSKLYDSGKYQIWKIIPV